MSCSGWIMKRSYDKALIGKYLDMTGYASAMKDFRDALWIAEYRKGEFITSPFQNERLFQIVVSGTVNIYCIRDDGSVHSLSNGTENYLIGEMELFSEDSGSVYGEASEGLTCLALSIDENRDRMIKSLPFILMISESLAGKMKHLTMFNAVPTSLRQRVLTYIEYRCRDKELKGLERAAFNLNCSPRQLQRILNQYEKEGTVCKTGKGSYCLVKDCRDEIMK